MTKNSFGEHLKREREMRGVTLEEISSATRIGTRFLEALENEQWDRLPGGVFNRGFVRAVARFLGLDEENLVAEYALVTKDQHDVAGWTESPAARSTGKRRLAWLLALLGVAVGAGGWFAYHHYASGRAIRAVAPRTPLPQAVESAPPAARPAPLPATASSGPTPAATSIETVGQRSAAAAPAVPTSAEPVTLELTVASGKTTVVSVVADGKSVFDGRMAAGQSWHFQAQERFEISVRNSSALLLELNGQTLPPLGPPGRPGRITLTRKDLKNVSGGLD